MAHELVRPSCLLVACVAMLAAAGPAQDKKRIENTVKRLEAKLDKIDGYLQSLEPATTQEPDGTAREKALATAIENERALQRRAANLGSELIAARQVAEDQALLTKAAADRQRELQAQIDALRQQLAENRTARESALRTLADSKAASREQALKTKASMAAEEKERARAEELQVEHTALAKALGEARANLERAGVANTNLKNTLLATEQHQQEFEGRARDLAAKLEAVSARLARYENTTNVHEASITTIGSTAETIRAENADLSDRLAAAEQRLADAMTQNEQLRAALEQRPATAQKTTITIPDETGDGNGAHGDIHIHNENGTVIFQFGSGNSATHAAQPAPAPGVKSRPLPPKQLGETLRAGTAVPAPLTRGSGGNAGMEEPGTVPTRSQDPKKGSPSSPRKINL